jgi:uracil-DNA glycosylase
MERQQDLPLHVKSAAKSAADFLPDSLNLAALKKAAAGCRGCDLYKNATQTVFGEGPAKATVMLVGEVPGDQEDRQGRPFVGPAGRILQSALDEAGIARETVYVTNAVKHFKWEPQGKRRKHKKPLASEIAACRPWLTAELQVTRPKIVVCLGVTAAESVLARRIRLQEERGRFISAAFGPNILVTAHPSAILRHPDKAQRDAEYLRLVKEMKLVHRKLLQTSEPAA